MASAQYFRGREHEMQKIKRGYAKIKANTWRSWGALALGYIFFWFYGLIAWFIPVTSGRNGVVALSWAEATGAVAFVTLGLVVMLFSFLVLWVAIKR